jgi:phosphatidylglycerol phospholipase C
MGSYGAKFLRDAKAAGRPVIGWTINEENMMRWSIKHELDGVITDDPKRFLEVCDEWEDGKRTIDIGLRQFLLMVWNHIMVMIFGGIFRWKYPFRRGIGYKPPGRGDRKR